MGKEETPKVVEVEETTEEKKEETNGHTENGNGTTEEKNGEEKNDGHKNGDSENGHSENGAPKRKVEEEAAPEPIPVSAEKIAKLTETTEEEVKEVPVEATS